MKKVLIPFLLLITSLSTTLCGQDYWQAEDYYNNSSSQKNAASDLMKYFEIQDSNKVLDVGCGDGKITAAIASKVVHGSVIGVDISPAMIDFAKNAFPQSNYPNLQFFIKDAQNLDYSSEFDVVVSFTALQWVQSHNTFLQGAYNSLKPNGTLAVTMPMGLPVTIEQAVDELITSHEWSPYFQNFSTGWNFVDDKIYGDLLAANHFVPSRLTVVPQKDIFPSRDIFQKFISQWFPYLRPLPQELKSVFMTQVIDRFLELEKPFPNGEVHFKVRRLEVVATKQ